MLRYPESPTSYQLSREFNAPKEQLYALFLNEAALKRLWGVDEIKLDMREGGKSKVRPSAEDTSSDFTLYHHTVVPNEHLSWDVELDSAPGNKVHVSLWFVKLIERCKFTVRIERFSSQEARNESRLAWEECLKRMEELVNIKAV